jgi:probable phosphoglycerate mutase
VDIGTWEDLPFGYLDNFSGEQMRNFNHDPVNWKAPGAESYWTYTKRFLDGMGEAVRNHENETIAIFAHGAVIRGVLARLFFDNDVSKLPYCDNTGVCKLTHNGDTYSYEYLNDNSHLPKELSTFALQFWWRSTDNRKDVNLYYVPYRSEMTLPSGLTVPEIDPKGFALAAILHGEPIAIVSMAAPEGDTGCVLGMALKAGMDGRLYGDQLLGAAFSHFRRLGCRKIMLNPGWYPDDIFSRYAFDSESRIRSIDTRCFDWDV